jgi:acetyl esterase/lipase
VGSEHPCFRCRPTLRDRAADFDEDVQKAYLRAGGPAAAFVFGPGTGRSLADEPAAVAAADPAQYVTAMTPPFLLFHGSADNAVSPSQTLTLHNVLREHGVESTRYLLAGAGHGDIAVALAGLEDELPPGVAVDDLVAVVGGIEGAIPWNTQELLGYVLKFLAERLSS